MKPIAAQTLAWVLGTTLVLSPAGLVAQAEAPASRAATVAEQAAADAAAATQEAIRRARFDARDVIRIGQDYTVSAGDYIRDLVLIFGSTTIDGTVEGDAVVIGGSARLADSAVIEGSFVVVGGAATIAPGATVRRDMTIVGSSVDVAAGFSAGGQQVIVGPSFLGNQLRAIGPWFTRGLFWGRLIVPNVAWVWTIVALLFLVYLVLNLLFDAPLAATARTLAAKPLSVFLVGLLVLLLVGPLCLALTMSVIGIAVVPFVLCALLAAALLGRVAVMRWMGSAIVHEGDEPSRAQTTLSFVIGFALLSLAYLVPVLGLVTWATVGVFGLGAVTMTFIAALRKENPAPPAPPAPVAPDAPPAAAAALATGEAAPGAAPAAPPPAAGASQPSEGPSIAAGFAGAAVPPTPPATSLQLLAMSHATFLDRLAAFILDLLLVAIAASVLDLGRYGHTSPSSMLALLLAYRIPFWAWKGTSVGGIICHLRLVRVDGTPLRFVDALVRGLSSVFSIVVLGLGCFWVLKDPEGQAWHDKIAGTYVVKVPQNWPL